MKNTNTLMKKTGLLRVLTKSSIISSIIIAVLSFAPGISQAAFTDNAPAIDALGQYTNSSLTDPQPIYTKGGEADSPNQRGLSGPSGVELDTVDHRLFVSDIGNRRVLVYTLNSDNTLPDLTPDYVLGAPDFTTKEPYVVTSTTIRGPTDLAYDSTRKRLFVADGGSSRVLIFDVASITNGEAAEYVLGQYDFTSTIFDSGINRLGGLNAIEYDEANDRLYAAASSNNKIVVFDTSTITNGEDPQQALVYSTSNNVSNTPTAGDPLNIYGLAYDATRDLLFASDTIFNRVLVYDVSTISYDQDAIRVLGQADFSGKNASATAVGTYQPRNLEVSGNILYVSQPEYYRTTAFDISTITNGEPAVQVFGQANFTAQSRPAVLASNFIASSMVADAAAQRLYVAGLNAIKIFDTSTVTDNPDPIGIIGQAVYDDPLNPILSAVRQGANDGPSPYGLSAGQTAIDEVQHRLFVADSANKRVLVFALNTDNTLQDHFPDYVLGQANFSEAQSGTTTANRLSSPRSLAFDPTTNRLFVGDSARVVVFDVQDITNGEDAVSVLGQPDLITSDFAFFPTAATMQQASSLVIDTERQLLFVGDEGNMRVQIFDVNVIDDGEDAIHVLGQADLETSDFFFVPTASSTSGPAAIAYDTEQELLFVTDAWSNRVLVFDVATIIDNEPAIHVFGQANLTANDGDITQSSTSNPTGLAFDQEAKRLFISQSGAHRVTVFDTRTIEDGEESIGILGQSDFTASTAATTATSFNNPGHLSYNAITDELYVSDRDNNRVLIFDAALPETGVTVEETGGSTAVTEDGVPLTDTFTVKLDTYIDSDVVIDATSSDPALSLDVATLTFTPDTWDIPQTITVTAETDANVVSETATVSLTIDADESDARYATVLPASITVSITDTTVPPVVPPVSSGGGGGGSGGSYTSGWTNANTNANATGSTNGNSNANSNTNSEGQVGNSNEYTPIRERGSASRFGDLSGHWSREYVDTLTKYCDVDGYANGEFRPDAPMLRAEFTALAIRCLGEKAVQPQKVFSDINSNAWYAGYIQKAFELGWIKGYPDMTFRSEKTMTREEAVTVLMKASFSTGELSTQAKPYTDVPSQSWYAPFANSAYVQGIMTGYKTAAGDLLYLFGVGEPVRRGEVAKILINLLEKTYLK